MSLLLLKQFLVDEKIETLRVRHTKISKDLLVLPKFRKQIPDSEKRYLQYLIEGLIARGKNLDLGDEISEKDLQTINKIDKNCKICR